MASPAPVEKVFRGIAAAPGVAVGAAFVFLRAEFDLPRFHVPPEGRENEIARFEKGLLQTRVQINAIRSEVQEKLGEAEAAIFDAHQLVLEDRALIEETISEVIESGLNIEAAFKAVADRYIEAFQQIEDDYIKERVTDIRDVSRRLLANLLGRTETDLELIRPDQILVGDDVTPSDTVHLGRTRPLAIATDLGGQTGHSAIMARSLGIPCVVGLPGFARAVEMEDEVLVDGFSGQVILNPSAENRAKYGAIAEQRAEETARFETVRHEPAITRDGHHVEVMLNVDGFESPDMLEHAGADGVGLFRTENLFLASQDFPNEETQYDAYRKVVSVMAPRPVTIRTLDLGGDKIPESSPYNYPEANPFMGFRAIRLCLENPSLFKPQLRAILRASAHGNVKVLYPLVTSADEVKAANALLAECRAELQAEDVPMAEEIPIGAMIETPSAAVMSDLLAPHCDFFSVGTNDLVQYLLAVDRVNERIAHLYEPNHPAVMRALRFTFLSGERQGVPVAVCGELAGDPRYAALLVGLGAQELSVTANALAEVKHLIRRLEFPAAEVMAKQVARAHETAEIATLLEDFFTALPPDVT